MYSRVYIVSPIESTNINAFQAQNRVAGKFFNSEDAMLKHLESLSAQNNVVIYRVACNADESRRIQEVLNYGEKANLAEIKDCAYKIYSKSQRNSNFIPFDPASAGYESAASRSKTPAASVASGSATMFNANIPSKNMQANTDKSAAAANILAEKLNLVFSGNQDPKAAADVLTKHIKELNEDELISVLQVYSKGQVTDLNLAALQRKSGISLLGIAMKDSNKAVRMLCNKAVVDTLSDDDITKLYLKHAKAIELRRGIERPGQILDKRLLDTRIKINTFREGLESASEIGLNEATNDARKSLQYLYQLTKPKKSHGRGKLENPSEPFVQDAIGIADIITRHAAGPNGLQYLKEVDWCRPDTLFELAMNHPLAAIRLLQNELIANYFTPVQIAQIANKHVKDQNFINAIELISNPLHPDAGLNYISTRVQSRGGRYGDRGYSDEERAQVKELFSSSDMQRLLESELQALIKKNDPKPKPEPKPDHVESDNPYQTLGVERNASASDIRKAFYAISKQHHPDKGAGADVEIFRKANEAYKVLSDPERRAAYDVSHPEHDFQRMRK